MAGGERVVEHRLAPRRVAVTTPRDGQVADHRVEMLEADRERLVDEVVAVDVEHVEEAHEQRRGRARGVVAPKRLIVSWKAWGAASSSTPSTSPSSTTDVDRQRAGDAPRRRASRSVMSLRFRV